MRCLNHFLIAFAIAGILLSAGCCTKYVYGPDYGAGYTHLTDNRVLFFDVERMSRLEFLEQIMDSADFPFYVWSVDARLLLANKAWEDVTGINRKKAIGKSMVELFPPPMVDDMLLLNREVIATWRSVRGRECYFVRPGEMAELDTVKWPVFNKDGRAIGVGGVTFEPPR